MKIQSKICLLAGVAALNLAYLPAIHAQTTTSTPTNQTGSEADSKSSSTSAAQVRDGSTGTGAAAASQPDKTNTKDTTNSLDKNPSTASSDSAPNSATKSPTTATTEDRMSRTENSGSSMGPNAGFSDKHFLVKAAQGGMTEVQLGQIAQKNAQSSSVKEFGARMVADHSKADADLKALATEKGVTVPDKLDPKHQAMVDKLSAMSGNDFDKAYVNDMVEDHKKDVGEFQKASTSAQDPDVQAFASKTLTTVKSHLADVENIQKQLK